jgi:hypothetical protein
MKNNLSTLLKLKTTQLIENVTIFIFKTLFNEPGYFVSEFLIEEEFSTIERFFHSKLK